MPNTWIEEYFKFLQRSSIVDLTHAFGTADGTLVDVTGTHSQTILNDNFKELSTKVNLILAALRNVGIIPS